MFEATARKLLGKNPRVQFVYGLDVTGLLLEDGGVPETAQQCVTGELACYRLEYANRLDG